MTRLVVNDWQTWLVWQSQHDAGGEFPAELLTLSPGILEALRDKTSITDLSQRDLERANALGEKVNEIALQWRERLDELYGPDFGGRRVGHLLARGIPQLLSALSYHWLALIPHLESGAGPVVVPYIPSQAHNDLPDPWPTNLTPQGLNYMALLALEAGDKAVAPLRLEPVNLRADAKFWPSESTVAPRFSDRLLNFALSLTGPPIHVLGFQLMKYLTGTGLLARIWRKMVHDEPRIVLLKSSNGNFMRALPQMAAWRWPLTSMALPAMPLDWKEQAQSDRRFENSIEKDIAELPEQWRCLEIPLRVAARRIDAYISGALLAFHCTAEAKIKQTVSGLVAGHKGVVLTNGLYQPTENLAGEYCREIGLTLVAFQHGASGLLAYYETMLRFCDMKRADIYVCYTPYERDYFRSLGEGGAKRFIVAGTTGVQNANMIRANRWLARRRWRVTARRNCLLYAPTQFKDGHVWLPHGIQDIPYWDFMRRMIFEVMGKVEGFDSILKFHRKGLSSGMASSRARRRLEPLDLIQMPKNVRTEYWPDLRYTRCTGDLIILDRATSTLGWLLHSHVPLIYVDPPFEPLLPEPRKAMKAGLFYIDASNPDWPEELLALLSRPMIELEKMWAEKADARKILCDHYVLGPKVSNREMANIIGEISNNVTRAARA